MRNFLVPLSAVALIGSIAVANAEEATGIIAAFDETSHAIQLESGELFMLGEGVPTDALAPGTEVIVTYEVNAEGQNVATDVQPAQAE